MAATESARVNPIGDISTAQLRGWVDSDDNDVFQSTRGLTPEKSAAVIAGLGLTIEVDEDAQDRRAEACGVSLLGRSL